MYVTNGILIGIVVWLVVISYFLFRSMKHYKGLVTRTKTHAIDDVLDVLVSQGKGHDSDIEQLSTAIRELDESRHGYFQKYGYVRFNPFNDRVGGDQSFVIALLDNKKNGIVQTCMYTRDGVRVYVKKIKSGLCEEYELSQEEKEAINNATA